MSLVKSMQKLLYIVNTFLVGFVIIMAFIFRHYGVTYMVWHSIPTVLAYIALYPAVYKSRMELYAMCVYELITLYMIASTICLGYSSGFILYSISLITLSFYMEYLARVMHTKKLSPMITSLFLVLVFIACTTYVHVRGPVYEVNSNFAFMCMIINSFSVFFFLIGYGSLMQKIISISEQKLSDMAHTDQLTGLFNRHYMASHLNDVSHTISEGQWLALADIDDFKNINDTYGHACGDYVLVELGRIMRQVCDRCIKSRWGGEEFLITVFDGARKLEVVEALRQAVENNRFTFNGEDISVTITVGVSLYKEGQSLDSWIQSADRRLYDGKGSGKNRVIY